MGMITLAMAKAYTDEKAGGGLPVVEIGFEKDDVVDRFKLDEESNEPSPTVYILNESFNTTLDGLNGLPFMVKCNMGDGNTLTLSTMAAFSFPNPDTGEIGYQYYLGLPDSYLVTGAYFDPSFEGHWILILPYV